MRATVSVVHEPGDFVLSSFRDRDGRDAPIRETEARIERIVDGLKACAHVRWHDTGDVADEARVRAAQCHDAAYLAFLSTTSRGGREVLSPAFSAPGLVPDTPVTADAFDAALRACGLAVAAARCLLAGERYAYAVCRPPGHHAGRSFLGGYCYLNNACIAAQVLCGDGRRVAVVDVDYHHGNGTADVLATAPGIPFVSLHASTLTAFPYIATAPVVPQHWFAAFDGVPSEAEYLDVLGSHLQHVAGVDAIVVSLGYDTVAGDPHGGWRMTPDFFTELARAFAATGCQLCVVQEGGYALDQLAACAQAFAEGLT